VPFPLRDVGPSVDPAGLDRELRNLRYVALPLGELQQLPYGRPFVLEGNDGRLLLLRESPVHVIGELGFRDLVDGELIKVLELPE
jgi:hypothetical protein